MTSYEFIFSDQRRHRLTRHVLFWILWSIAYNLFYQFPIHEFLGYGGYGPHAAGEVNKMGGILYFLRVLLINSFLGVIAPQVLFVYVLFHWLLPRFFYRKRNPFLTLTVVAGMLAVFLLVAAYFKMSYPIFRHLSGETTTWPKLIGTGRAMLLNQLISFPIVVGLALTIKLIKRWWLKHQETEQMAREKTKAELQLLKAQVHPHFLFNTLNNIYFFILSGSQKAPEMISKLSGLLDYILNECNQPMVPLEKEMKMIQDYVSLEKIRYGEEMKLSVELPGNGSDKLIAPLLLIPFIENSFKHGASKMLKHPFVKLTITIDGDMLHLSLKNSRPLLAGPGLTKACLPNRDAGRQGNIGLKNVKKRLELLYPADHTLDIVEEGESFAVYLKVRLVVLQTTPNSHELIKPVKEYAMG